MECHKCGRKGGCVLPIESKGRGVYWEGDESGCRKYLPWKPKDTSTASNTTSGLTAEPGTVEVPVGSGSQMESSTPAPVTILGQDIDTMPANAAGLPISLRPYTSPPRVLQPEPTLPTPYFTQDGITIYHGSSLEILPLLKEKVDLLLTDPPYGMSFRSNMRTATEKFKKIAGDEKVDTSWLLDATTLVKKGGAAYIFTRWDVYGKWVDAVNKHMGVRNCLIWWKRGGGMGDLRGNFSPEHEFIIFAHRGDHQLRGKRVGNVLMVDKEPPSTYLHPTQKPVDLIRLLMMASSDKDQLVLDPFMGSGTTLRAAKDLGRRAIGIELEEKYCEVAARRLAQGVLF